MKRTISALIIILMPCVSATTQVRQQELVDTVAARVGQEVILLSEIRNTVGQAMREIRQNTGSQTEYERQVDSLMERTLNEMIDTKILYREALRNALNITDEAVERRVQAVRDRFDTEEEFMEYINEAGLTLSKIREDERKFTLAAAMLENKRQALADAIVIDEADITEFYEENEDEFVTPEQVRVRQIMMRARRDTPERAEARARLELLRDEILAGASFEELAKKYSQAPGAEDGGIIGWQKRGDLVPVLENAAFDLEIGGVSEVIGNQFGVYLLTIDDRKESGAITKEDARAQIEPYLRRQQVEDGLDRWLSDLRKLSNVRIYL